MDRNFIEEEIRNIIDKYIGRYNSDYVKTNIKNDITHYLTELMSENIISNYGDINIIGDKDCIKVNITPNIVFTEYIIKYIYTAETNFFVNGYIYDIYFNNLSPKYIKLNDKLVIDLNTNLHREVIISMIDKEFVELSIYRNNRIDEILKD